MLFVLCEWGGRITFVMLLDKTNGVITECVFRHGNKSYNYRTPLQAQTIMLHRDSAIALQKLRNAKHTSPSLGHNKFPIIRIDCNLKILELRRKSGRKTTIMKIKLSDSRAERFDKLSPIRFSSYFIFLFLKGYFSNPLSAFKILVSNRLLCTWMWIWVSWQPDVEGKACSPTRVDMYHTTRHHKSGYRYFHSRISHFPKRLHRNAYSSIWLSQVCDQPFTPYKTTNVMHWILFIRQILLLSSTCFEYQVLIFRRT